MLKINKEEFISVCKNSSSMAAAAAELGIHFNTFKRYAVQFECYEINQGGKGTNKPRTLGKIPLDEILIGLHPQYQTYKLKQQLIKTGLKENKCEWCDVSSWNGLPLMIELDHINGDSKDHRLENLRMLCPNCHSQTDTFRARNIH